MSMLINQGNIKLFISYLFQKRNGNYPPPELLHSWSQVPDADILEHLRKMTGQWGWTEAQLLTEIHNFLNTQTPAAHTPPPKQPHKLQETAVPGPARSATPPKKKSRSWLLLILLPLLGIGGYVTYKNYQYNNLQHLYSVTDNVAIRNARGEHVGRMDIFARGSSITSLREADSKIYNIVVDQEGNISESRKLLAQDATFKDFLLHNEDKMVYVNKNYLTNSADYGAIQKTVFSEMSQYPREMTSLKSDIRKVIIGSLAIEGNVHKLYIKNPCGNNSSEFTSVIKHTLKDKKTISVICKMSDHKFYKFKGIPDENIYYPPQEVQVKNPEEGTLVHIESADLLFKYTNGSYFLYTCNKENTSFHAVMDNSGDISYFAYSFDAL